MYIQNLLKKPVSLTSLFQKIWDNKCITKFARAKVRNIKFFGIIF